MFLFHCNRLLHTICNFVAFPSTFRVDLYLSENPENPEKLNPYFSYLLDGNRQRKSLGKVTLRNGEIFCLNSTEDLFIPNTMKNRYRHALCNFYAFPNAFNPIVYLDCNSDVKDSRTNPYKHYLKFGRKENRILGLPSAMSKQAGKSNNGTQSDVIPTENPDEEVYFAPVDTQSYEDNEDFTSYNTDVKVLAFYLPQFHPIKENDAWWGKGFTEWTNVSKAHARYQGHNQPRVPHKDIGEYNLLDVNTIYNQVKLAKQHGIFGFAIYYYWFSGIKLLDKPIELLYNHKEIQFPFFLVWANENWTRGWDGKDNDVLIQQKYNEKDPFIFISDLKKYLLDSRYIRSNNKPVIGIYNYKQIPNIGIFIQGLRTAAYDLGIGDIAIWACCTDIDFQEISSINLFDAIYEFPPRGKEVCKSIRRNDTGVSYSYRHLIELSRRFVEKSNIPIYRCSMAEWDNSARRKENYHNWFGYTNYRFYIYNRILMAWTKKNHNRDERFIFVNAWNEWGEGSYLEPDKHLGYATINSLSKAIFSLPYNNPDLVFVNSINDPINGDFSRFRICVQAHVYYEDLISEIIEYTNNIPANFDLYITTTTNTKKTILDKYVKNYSRAKHVCIDVVDNVGRDVIPFINQMKEVITKYDYLCHIHTKKSLHNSSGDRWRHYLLDNLLGNNIIVSEILDLFQKNPKLGIICPQSFYEIKNFFSWGDNINTLQKLFNELGLDFKIDPRINKANFPEGNMFWARTKAIAPIFSIRFSPPEEAGQTDGTIMHAIERSWILLARMYGYSSIRVRNLFDNIILDV